jgi:excisionase family DNA binding protein
LWRGLAVPLPAALSPEQRRERVGAGYAARDVRPDRRQAPEASWVSTRCTVYSLGGWRLRPGLEQDAGQLALEPQPLGMSIEEARQSLRPAYTLARLAAWSSVFAVLAFWCTIKEMRGSHGSHSAALSVREVAAELGVSEQAVRRWLQTGELRGLRLGSHPLARYRVEREALREFVRPAERSSR